MSTVPSGFLIQPGQTWVCLGDSITEDPAGYVSICIREIEKRFPGRRITFVNSGISGNKANDMRARFDQDVLSHKPNWVSISVGVNDVWHGFFDFERNQRRPVYDESTGHPLRLFNRDLEHMVAQLHDSGIGTLLIAPTVVGDDPARMENVLLREYARNLASLAEQFDAEYCPMHDIFWETLNSGRKANPAFALTTDGVHMNSVGAHMMAVGVLTSLAFYR